MASEVAGDTDHVVQVLDLAEEEHVGSGIVEEDSEHGREVVDDMPVGLEVDLPIAVVGDTAVVQEDIGLVYLDLEAADTSSFHHRAKRCVVVRLGIVARTPSTLAAEDKVDDYGLPFMQS